MCLRQRSEPPNPYALLSAAVLQGINAVVGRAHKRAQECWASLTALEELLQPYSLGAGYQAARGDRTLQPLREWLQAQAGQLTAQQSVILKGGQGARRPACLQAAAELQQLGRRVQAAEEAASAWAAQAGTPAPDAVVPLDQLQLEEVRACTSGRLWPPGCVGQRAAWRSRRLLLQGPQ